MVLEYLAIAFTSLSLAMDAFCVSIADGLSYKDINKKHIFFIALIFGVFQGVMPIIGYYAGKSFYSVIEDFDHWIAFSLLTFIGGKMIVEGILSLRKKEEVNEKQFSFKEVIIQGVATSIDALVVGIALLSSPSNIFIDATLICVITFGMCLLGLFLGKTIVKLFKGKIEIATIIGGLVQILIGTKILLEHLGILVI